MSADQHLDSAADEEVIVSTLHEDAELLTADHCGIRAFILRGECKDKFLEWQECIKSTNKEKDADQKCEEVTNLLIKCMHSHVDYYRPVLMAEKKVQAEAAQPWIDAALEDTP